VTVVLLLCDEEELLLLLDEELLDDELPEPVKGCRSDSRVPSDSRVGGLYVNLPLSRLGIAVWPVVKLDEDRLDSELEVVGRVSPRPCPCKESGVICRVMLSLGYFGSNPPPPWKGMVVIRWTGMLICLGRRARPANSGLDVGFERIKTFSPSQTKYV
jgi:hypothetical protein